MSITYDLEQNLGILEAMAANLTPYLYEEELFGQISNNLPKLTVGGMLMRLYQLKHLVDALDSEQQQRLHDAEVNIDAARSEWALHYEQKVSQELASRLGALVWYLDDCARDPDTCGSGWLNEAEKRTIVAHLRREAEQLDILADDIKSQIAQVDSRLRRYHRDGDFLWDARLTEVYPRSDFWWLYGRVTGDND